MNKTKNDPTVAKFWRDYWLLASERAPELGMKEPSSEKGAESTYISFFPASLPRDKRKPPIQNGISIIHKLVTPKGSTDPSKSCIDLQLSGMGNNIEALRGIFGKYLSKLQNSFENEMESEIVQTEKSAAIRLWLRKVDVHTSVDIQKQKIIESIEAGQKLLAWFEGFFYIKDAQLQNFFKVDMKLSEWLLHIEPTQQKALPNPAIGVKPLPSQSHFDERHSNNTASGKPDKVPITEDNYNFDLKNGINKAKRMSESEVNALLSNWPKIPKRIPISADRFDRNPYVIVKVLRRAKGVCEKCGKAAPFLRRSDGSPYLEVHHKIFLSAGGEDTVENSEALCPNCHRERHHS